MSRIEAREIAFEKIYSQMFTLEKNLKEEREDEDLVEKLHSEEDLKFLENILHQFANNYDEVNKNISESLKKYTLDQLYRVDLAILSVAMTELFYVKDTPLEAVINEAVSLAKKYSTENSYKFINGFLADVVKKYKIDYKVEATNAKKKSLVAELTSSSENVANSEEISSQIKETVSNSGDEISLSIDGTVSAKDKSKAGK